MTKYKVAIMQTTTQVFVVEAVDAGEAIEKLSDEWDKGNIELDNPNSEVDFSIIGQAGDRQ